jgi:hypothetical protein
MELSPEPPPDPTPKQISQIRLPEPLPKSEKEVYEITIAEQKAEIADLNKKLKEATAPAKKKSVLERFSPL